MKNRIKLLVVTPYFYPELGGVAVHTYNLYKILKRDYKFEIVVITSSSERKKCSEEEISGMRVYKLPYWFKLSNTPINPWWYFQIKEIIGKEKPDVISAHTPVPFIADVAAMVCGNIPLILKYHHAGSMVKGQFPIDLLIRLYESIFFKFVLRKAEIIISSSDFVRLRFFKKYSNKTVTITPGVDLDRFRFREINLRSRILFVANNLDKSERYKGLEYLLFAIPLVKKKFKDTKLMIVGDGSDVNYYKTICRGLKIERNVVFKGRLVGEELVREYQQTNVLVLSSLLDSCPNVLLEAMACKKPVIGSDTGGILYLIDHGENGFLFPPKDSKALAEAIIKIFENPNLARRMGGVGYNKVSLNFAWEAKARETKEVIEAIRLRRAPRVPPVGECR